MPPYRAIEIAVRYSVTVSIAAETKGMFSVMFFVSFELVFTSLGRTSEYAGTSRISSKVRAFLIFRMFSPHEVLVACVVSLGRSIVSIQKVHSLLEL